MESVDVTHSGSMMATGDLLSAINKATLTASGADYTSPQRPCARTGRGAPQPTRNFRRKSDKPRKRKRNHEASLSIVEQEPQDRPNSEAFETTPAYLSAESEKPGEESFLEKIPEKGDADQKKKFKTDLEVV